MAGVAQAVDEEDWLMKVRYKLAVKWACGSYEGIVGEGHTEDQARDNALKELIKISDKQDKIFKLSWQIIKPSDVYLLDQEDQEKLKNDWEECSNRLDRWGVWP